MFVNNLIFRLQVNKNTLTFYTQEEGKRIFIGICWQCCLYCHVRHQSTVPDPQLIIYDRHEAKPESLCWCCNSWDGRLLNGVWMVGGRGGSGGWCRGDSVGLSSNVDVPNCFAFPSVLACMIYFPITTYFECFLVFFRLHSPITEIDFRKCVFSVHLFISLFPLHSKEQRSQRVIQ